MARVRSVEKRSAILEAAIEEIAETGLQAATAKIAARAGVAAGSLFTYFATKEELFNELYLELKSEVYARISVGFPEKGSLERRARHIWLNYLGWAIEAPARRKVSAQLNLCDVITAETRSKTAIERSVVYATLNELETRGALRGLPRGFAAVTMMAMQEATLEFVAREPAVREPDGRRARRREELIERAFQIFWRAVR